MIPQKQYQEIYNDLIASRGPKGPTKNLVRRGIPEAQAKAMVAEVYRALKWDMRKVHIWKLLGSGAILLVLVLIMLFTGRIYFIWMALAGFGFLYSLFQFTFAVGVDLGD